MKTLLADYERERRAFQALLEPDCRRRILLFHGESGCGKTTLTRACLELLSDDVACIRVQLRGSAVGVADILSRAGQRLGWKRLRRFTRQVAALENPTQINIDQIQITDNWLKGINHSINVALHAEDLAGRRRRRRALTDAWFQDVSAFNQPLLVAIDTFEQASEEVRDWISGPFLARVAGARRVRVLVAGREVPNANNIEWGHCCTAHGLYGVRDAQDWKPVVEGLGRYIPFENPMDWLAGVCHALQGRPSDIMQVIQGLPRRERRT